ncbi:MAG: alpha-L-rhamnosidase [Planctomycetota bacterium]|jgi:alpha-L-rhamnosidase
MPIHNQDCLQAQNRAASSLVVGCRFLVITVFLLITARLNAQDSNSCLIAPYRLRCDGVVKPNAVSDSHPVFRWSLKFATPDKIIDTAQASYRVRIWSGRSLPSEDESFVWDSGRVQSDSQQLRLPADVGLSPRKAYGWDLQVWDQDKRPSEKVISGFRMAPAKGEEIRGKWIGSGEKYEPLLSPPEGFLSSTIASQSKEHLIVIDLGGVFPIESIRLIPARPFRAAVDNPGIGFPLRFEVAISRSARKEDARTIYSCLDHDFDGKAGAVLAIEPSKAWGRFIAIRTEKRFQIGLRSFVAFSEIEVTSKGKNIALNKRVRVSDQSDDKSYDPSFLVDGELPKGEIDQSADGPAVFFGREFHVTGKVTEALLRICSLGALDLWINGRPISSSVYGSADSDFDTRSYFQTIDVGSLLRPGKNILQFVLGHGRFGSRVPDVFQSEASVWKQSPRLIAELEFEDSQGRQVLGTDETWFLEDGYILDQGFRNGETHSGLMQHAWHKARKTGKRNRLPVKVLSTISTELTPQVSPPLSMLEPFECVNVTKTQDHVYVIDFGENIAGTFKLRFQGPAGTKVVVDAREQLNDDGSLDLVSSSWATLGRFQRYEFVLSGMNDEFFPRLSRAGFRYLQLMLPSGTAVLAKPLAMRVRTELKKTLLLETSHKSVDLLRELSLRTLESCCQTNPIDSPQRERLGWLLDGYVASAAYMIEWDSERWLLKWIGDINDAQNTNGYVPSVVPGSDLFDAANENPLGHFADPWWGGAICFLPWEHYLHYGDVNILRLAFPGMKKWIGLLQKLGGTRVNGWGLGDWHEPHGTIDPSSIAFVSTMGFHRAVTIAAKVARVLKQKEESARLEQLANRIARDVLARFPINAEYLIDAKRQAPQVLALWGGLIEDHRRPKMLESLRAQIFSQEDCRVDTGYVSTHALLSLMHDEGLGQDVLRVLLNKSEASWLRFVDQGFSTFPETWQPPSDSMNHLPLASVDSALVRLHGVPTPLEKGPGFKVFRVWPQAMKEIREAQWEFESPRGLIRCHWRWDNRVLVDLEIPPGSKAELVLDVASIDELTVNGIPISELDSCTTSSLGKNHLIELPAGSFAIRFLPPTK